MRYKFRFIEDPGHGWLEAPLQLLKSLGIAKRITHYSYLDSFTGMAYLEEDYDYSIFSEAMILAGNKFEIEEVHQENTFVRDLPSFSV